MASSVIKADALFVRSVTVPWSVSGSGTYTTNLYTIINNDLPSGYKCLGIVGFDVGQNQQMLVHCLYKNDSLSFYIRNMATSDRSGTATIQYLCAPN